MHHDVHLVLTESRRHLGETISALERARRRAGELDDPATTAELDDLASRLGATDSALAATLERGEREAGLHHVWIVTRKSRTRPKTRFVVDGAETLQREVQLRAGEARLQRMTGHCIGPGHNRLHRQCRQDGQEPIVSRNERQDGEAHPERRDHRRAVRRSR